MRFRSLALLLPLAVAVPAFASNVYLKVKADSTAGQPVKVTVKALSRVSVTLPAEPIVYVDEGQGFKARPDVHCRIANTDTGLRLEADREYAGTCELLGLPSGSLRLRLGYKQADGLSTSNAVPLQATGAATARAAQ
jgi:hypothetical protein